jgi:excisionase family DNA binding protein
MTANDSLLRLAEVAQLLSLSQGSVRRLVKTGLLPRTEFSARAHRFRLSDVQKTLEALTLARRQGDARREYATSMVQS